MDCVFVKARKISKALKGNRGSAVNYSKYLTRELERVDYAEKGEILSCGIVGTNEKPLEFWKKAEERENQTKRRATARYAKEYIVAMPYQMPTENQAKLCKTIAEKLSLGNRVVQWVHHEPDRENSDKNFHAHFLMSEREYTNGFFSEKKNRDWNSKKCLADHKKEIGNEINKELEKLNLPKIKIELEEERETIADKTESQKRVERKQKKQLEKTEKKLKLAEVKLNGFGRFENGLRYTADTNTDIFAEYQQHRADERAEAIRIQNARRIAEEQQRKLEKNSRGLQRTDKNDFSIGR